MALLTSESADVREASGTAVSVAGLAEALSLNGVNLAVLRARRHPLGHTVGRAAFNGGVSWPQGAYDVVAGIGGDGHAAAGRAGVPFIALPKALYGAVVDHEGALTRAVLRRHAAWEARGARAAARVIVPSRFAAGFVHEHFDVAWKRIEVIPEPFAVSAWRASMPRSVREGRRVLVVAHLYARKRVRDVVAAWPAVLRARPDALLDIVGDGPELGVVRRAAGGVPGIMVHGHVARHRLPALYARADVAVSASAHETFGYAVLEALASGLPVVAADAAAVLELCDGAVEERVKVGDVDGLATSILRVLSPAVADAAAAANPLAAARCESALIGARYVQALRSVLA